MKEILVKDILELCNGEIIYGSENNEIKEVKKDTREINNGDTYIGFKGEHNDGNLMYLDALKNGAQICILEKSSVENRIKLDEIKTIFRIQL